MQVEQLIETKSIPHFDRLLGSLQSMIKRNVRAIGSESCAWCGSEGKHYKTKRVLKQYGVNDDWRGDSWQDKLFCSVDCMRVYNGISSR